MPLNISSDGHPIYSLDVHPEGNRLATAGYDGKIKLWALKPIRIEDVEKDASAPKLLCALTGHTRAPTSLVIANSAHAVQCRQCQLRAILARQALPGISQRRQAGPALGTRAG